MALLFAAPHREVKKVRVEFQNIMQELPQTTSLSAQGHLDGDAY